MVLGIGGSNTMAVIEEIKSTDLSEIDAILSVSPYYSKPTQEGIYQHFKAISEASPLPIIVGSSSLKLRRNYFLPRIWIGERKRCSRR